MTKNHDIHPYKTQQKDRGEWIPGPRGGAVWRNPLRAGKPKKQPIQCENVRLSNENSDFVPGVPGENGFVPGPTGNNFTQW